MKFNVQSKVWLACFAAVAALGACVGNGGLDTNDGVGGSGAVAGNTGDAGKGGSMNGGSGGMSCGPVCAIACEFGNVLDASGCPTCSCNPGPKECSAKECPPVPDIAKICPDGSAVGMSCKRGSDGKCAVVAGECPTTCKPLACKLACAFGLVKDTQGCDTCACAPGPICKVAECGPPPPVAPCPGGKGPGMSCERNASTSKCNWNIGQCAQCAAPVCAIFCEFGNKLDDKGCATCACNPAPVCTDKLCGPGPKVPTQLCEDGSSAGPVCGPDSKGGCGWQITLCPAACGDARNLQTCELNSKCQWLEPGCSGNKLPVAGCFVRTSVNCDSNEDCASGKQCVSRTVDHCAMRPNLKCFTCASPTNVCL